MKADLTIVLPTKNSEKFLYFFLKSLEKQDYKNFLLLVADSSSTDNTLGIIKKCSFNFNIVSYKDISAEDGINKCLKRVKTKYFAIFNSDDVLGNKNYISSLIKLLQEGTDVAFPNSGIIINNIKKFSDQKDTFENILYKNISPDIGWIAKKTILREGLFTTKYKVATAYHFLLRLYKKNYYFKRDRSIYYFFRLGGNSHKNAALGWIENKNISIKLGSSKFFVYKQFLINFIKFFIKYKILRYYFKIER
jgi:glycosyltransferase involved in cell wall biosynthesis